MSSYDKDDRDNMMMVVVTMLLLRDQKRPKVSISINILHVLLQYTGTCLYCPKIYRTTLKYKLNDVDDPP